MTTTLCHSHRYHDIFRRTRRSLNGPYAVRIAAVALQFYCTHFGNMKAINRSFYHTIEAESYSDRPSCLVCGFVFANGTSEDSHYSYVDPRYRTGSSICRAEALEDWKASGKKNWWKRTWWNTSRASQSPWYTVCRQLLTGQFSSVPPCNRHMPTFWSQPASSDNRIGSNE